jgi:hypothetical protein
MSTQEQDGCTELTCPQHGHANREKALRRAEADADALREQVRG